jgi:capsular polysaccharide biosynthesis protein
MQLSDIWLRMRQFWIVVVVVAIAGGAAGAYRELSRPTAYVSTIRMFASNKVTDSVPISQSTNLALQRMDSYVPLVDSTELAQRVITSLGLRESPSRLAANLSAAFDKDTVLVTVSAKAPTAAESQAIVGAVPEGLTDLVSSLTEASSPGQDSPTRFTTFDGPSTQRTRSWPKVAVSTVFGLLVGVALGAALASLLARRRQGLRSPEELRDLTGRPVVGIIPTDSTFDPVNIPAGSRRRRWDACRRLAFNLQLLVPQPRHYVVVVTGVAAGVGTTETAQALAAALAVSGEEVLLVDAGADDSTREYAAGATIGGPKGKHPNLHEDDIVGLTRTAVTHDVILARHGVMQLMQDFRDKYDVTVVDAPPVLTRIDTAALVLGADAVLLVTDQFGTPAQDVLAAAETLRAMGGRSIGNVFNKVDPSTTRDSRFRSGVSLVDPAMTRTGTVGS